MENQNLQKKKLTNICLQEKLTDRIKGLLAGYKDGISIFKELIQNADDAGASVIKFCYDKRENDQWKNKDYLFDHEMAKLQGPSLFVFNDAMFTDQDFDNLSKLGGATKLNVKEKIGKFGLGFCAVYNITDVPFILSGSTFVAYDPNIKYLPSRVDGAKHGIRIKFNEHIQDYPDQFKPYENIFGCKIFDQNFYLNGTLMRLPLRNEPSDITRHVYNKESEISSLFEILYKNANSLLLFTQHVKKVEFYTLEDNSLENSEMKFLFNFKKSPICNLQNIEIHNIEQEFMEKSSILKLALNSPNIIESSFIIENTISINKNNFSLFFNNKFNIEREFEISYWLSMCSFDPKYLILDDENFKNFLPCVGMATELKSLVNSSIKKYELKQINGSAFCFLPLSIQTMLNYHINGPFSLSEDRLRFFENTKDDKNNNNKHKWNEYLLKPLAKNLLSMIKHAIKCCYIKSVNDIIETFWPIKNNLEYFRSFERVFYQEMCTGKTDVFPYLNDELVVELCSFEKSLFVDFYFDDETLQNNAIFILRKISKLENSHNLIYLPRDYLSILKDNCDIDKAKLIDEYDLLEKIIVNKNQTNFKLYEQLIRHYLSKKCCIKNDGESKYSNLIANYECIPTCNGNFKYIRDLINPEADLLYLDLFEKSDDMFPSECLCKDKKILENLSDMGLINKDLTSNILIKQISKVGILIDLNLNLAKTLSSNLLKYLDSYFKRNISIGELFDLKAKINELPWLFSKPKPNNWPLPWFSQNGKENLIYKPKELFSDENALKVGCIKPMFESCYANIIQGQSITLDIIIEQINFLINFNKNSISKEQEVSNQLEIIFENFYEYIMKNLEKLNENQVKQYLNEIKLKLSHEWILNKENNLVKFAIIESCALDVQNPIQPDLIKLSSYKNMKFFEKIGISENFSLEYLKNKIIELKKKFNDNPLDKTSQTYCSKVIQEMIYVNRKLAKTELNYSIHNSAEIFYLPDVNWILRSLDNLCSDHDTTFLTTNKNTDLFVLEKSISAQIFGIKTAKQKLFSNIRIPFGQKESLVLRINNILSRYSTDLSVFKELVQNADDAGATEIKFILDKRKRINTNNAYERLQGPALCCWHDSIFSERDFEGIISLGIGSKQSEIDKCGRFGVGFNSVYHLTDCPQFISNASDYVVFDPLCECFPDLESSNPGCRIPNGKIKLPMFTDILRGFEVGLELKGATLFRFPLRTVESNLSRTTFDIFQIDDLIQLYSEASKDMLIFLKNIKNISFYYFDESMKLDCLNQESLETRSQNINERSIFIQELNKNLKLKDNKNIKDKQISYTVTVCNNKSEKVEYLILEKFGWNGQSNVNIESENNCFKFFPHCGIALNLNSIFLENFDSKYKIYNYLPLNQDSPLSCHLNGHWCLHEENRIKLYEFGQKNDNISKEKSAYNKLAPEWNLLLINNIICPLYIDLFKTIKEKINEELAKNSRDKNLLLNNYFKLFPQNLEKNSLNDSYFKQMYLDFYKKMYEINCIPIENPKNGLVEWYKPSELIFIMPLKLFFNTQIGNKCIFDQIIEIMINLDIKICTDEQYLKLFKEFGDIKLKEINPYILIHGLKCKSANLVNLELNKSILINLEYVQFILKFCLSTNHNINHNDFDQCPLLITNDNKLKKFQIYNKTFIFDNPEIFEQQQDKFLNRKLHSFFPQKFSEIFFKSIDITDLAYLLPFALNSDVYYNSSKEIFLTETKTKIIIQHIWTIITYHIKKIYNDQSKTKKNILDILKSIENWSLIPVNVSSNPVGLFLLPITKCDLIIKKSEAFSRSEFISNILYKVNLPTLNTNLFWNSEITNLLNLIVMTLSRNEDILNFLDKNKKNEMVFKSNSEKIVNAKNFRKFFDDSIILTYPKKRKVNSVPILKFSFTEENSFTEYQVKEIINNLPIFTDIFNRVEARENKTMLILNLESFSLFFSNILNSDIDVIGDLIDFCNKKNLFILKKEICEKKLYDYLDLTEINIEQLYKQFFDYWCSHLTESGENPEIFIAHLNILTYMNSIKEISNQHLLNHLKYLKFIKTTSNEYFCANKIYDDQNELFKLVFHNRLLPEKYRTPEWRNLLIKLGLKTKCNSNDCIEIAQTLNKKYFSRELNLKDIEKFAKFLVKEIEDILSKEIDVHLLDNFKSIKFIPNYYFNLKKSVHEKIFSPLSINNNELICFENSTVKENENIAWTVKSILPDYCEDLIKLFDAKLFGIFDINEQDVIENFKKVLENIESNKNVLCDLNKTEIKIVFGIFKKTYQNLWSSKNFEILNQLKEINCVLKLNSTTDKLELCSFRIIFRDLNETDRIEGLIEKIPSVFLNNWDFFEYLGAKEKIDLEHCQNVLRYYFNITQSRSDKKLNNHEYKNVIKIYNILLSENFFNQNDVFDEDLYAPNMRKNMMPLNSLCFVDNLACEKLLNKCEVIKDLCLFDIKDLEIRNDNSLIHLMFENLNWNQIFQNFSFFKINPCHAATPISKILVEQIVEDCDMIDEPIEHVKTKKLHGENFSKALIKSIFILDEQLSVIDLHGYLNIKIQEILDNLFVYEKELIKSHFYNLKTKEKVENSEKETDLAQYKLNGVVKFFIKKNLKDETNLVDFYLSETIVEEIEQMILNSTFENIDPSLVQLMKEIIQKKSNRLCFLVWRLILSDENLYDSIIDEFNSKTLFNI